jgi:crotonobetainyl-CoA:carnitine CoA-transferase CaiB-like acyl-CoA transferase
LQQLHLRILAMVNLRALMQRRWCDVTRTVLAMTGTTPGLPPADLPLAGLRIVDLTDGLGELGVRYLADLGADVIRVEPLEGARSRRSWPLVDGVSLHHLTHNANKRAVTIDVSDRVAVGRLARLIDSADIVIEPGPRGWPATLGITPAELRAAHPALVVATVTDFGVSGPYRDWAATDAVHHALAGILARSGLPGLEPLIPPGSLAVESAALQLSWVTLAAYLGSVRTGEGEHVDLSVFEATAQVLDPGFGMGGSATAGAPPGDRSRGRPDARHLYPILRCADGWVRICVLSARQWAGMFRWLGEPAEFGDRQFESLAHRHTAAVTLLAAYETHFAPLTREVALEQGALHGVPTAAVLTLGDVLDGEHYRARGSFVDLPLAAGESRPVRVPNGLVEIDGRRAGIRRAAPGLGEHNDEVFAELDASPPRAAPEPAEPGLERPLAGVRVLDLGVIVVGAEVGRLLADMGAEVIKVENSAFPDGSRQAFPGQPMMPGFARGHRNKSSLGVNLRDPRGRELFLELVAQADVVLSNFKPGTLESLGLGPDRLVEANPGIIVADSSAFGSSGPWSRRMGYGPLVRASTGLSDLWRYPDVEDGFSDASTIYPDHVAARVAATAVLAKLIQRRRTGVGGRVSLAQAETILTCLSDQVALESIRPGTVVATGNHLNGDVPRGVFPCAGDDEWVAITIRGDEDFAALADAIGRRDLLADERFATAVDRLAHRAELELAVAAWTRGRRRRDAADVLQARAVPAGPMNRVPDLVDDPQLSDRAFLAPMRHPLFADPILAERAHACFERLPDPERRPAPIAGEHTRAIVGRLLGLGPSEIEHLLADGVLEALAVADPITRLETDSPALHTTNGRHTTS